MTNDKKITAGGNPAAEVNLHSHFATKIRDGQTLNSYQQVNNGGQPQSNLHAQAGENLKSTNGLLEDNTHEWMDTGAQETASGNNKELETVGEKYGAEDGSG